MVLAHGMGVNANHLHETPFHGLNRIRGTVAYMRPLKL